MNAKSIKLIRRFVRYSDGSLYDVERIKREYKNMNWIMRSRENKRMKEIMNRLQK